MNSLTAAPASSNTDPPGADFLSVREAATVSLDTFLSNRKDQVLVDSMRTLALSPDAAPPETTETTADGFESFDQYWHALPFTSPLSADEENDNHYSEQNNAQNPDFLPFNTLYEDSSRPSTPLPEDIDVEVSEYELEIDSNASTPAHIRAEREEEIERLRIEEEERLEKIRLEKEAADIEAKVQQALKIEAEEKERFKEEEEERKRIAEEEERIRIAEEKSQAAQAKKEQLKAMAQSVLEEERQLPSRRNSSWTKEATARKSILKNRHSIAPIAHSSLLPIREEENEKENDSPLESSESPPALVDYDSESSTWSKHSSVSSRRTSVQVEIIKSAKSRRKSIATGTQSQAALVDYPNTPNRFSLAYSTTASSPGSSVAGSEPRKRVSLRRRLEEDMEENGGISEPKLERIRRASLAAPPPRLTEKGTMFRESLNSPEMKSEKRQKNMVDCAIMCEPDQIDAEMAIMFAEFDMTTVGGADIPPITASMKKAAEKEPSPLPQPQSPQITFVEQAVSIQTPGKTVSHEVINSAVPHEPPSSAVRAFERLLSQIGEGDDAVRVVEVDRGQSPEPSTPNTIPNGTDTPNTGLATMASSARDSIMSPPELPNNLFSPLPPSSAGSARRKSVRGKQHSPAIQPDSEDRRNRLMVSAAKPPKSPKSPSYANLSAVRRTRRSLRFQNNSPMPAETNVEMHDEDEEQRDGGDNGNILQSTSFAIPQNRLSSQIASGVTPTVNSAAPSPASSGTRQGRARRRGSKKTITIERNEDISIDENHLENHVHIDTETIHHENSISNDNSNNTTKRVPRRSSRNKSHQGNDIVHDVVYFDFPAAKTLGAAIPRTSTHAMNVSHNNSYVDEDDDDLDNNHEEEEEDLDIRIIERTSKKISRRTSATSTRIDSKSTRSAAAQSTKSNKRTASHDESAPSSSTAVGRNTRSKSEASTSQNSMVSNGLRRSSRRTVGSSRKSAIQENQVTESTVQLQDDVVDVSDDEPLALMSSGEPSESQANSGPSRRANGSREPHEISRTQRNVRGQKRTRKSMSQGIMRKQLDDEDAGRRRRGKRARFEPLSFWLNEKPIYERRNSQQLPTIKELEVAVTNGEKSEVKETTKVQKGRKKKAVKPVVTNERETKEEVAQLTANSEVVEEDEEINQVQVEENQESHFPPDDPQSPEDHGHGIIADKVEVVEDERSARRMGRMKRKAETEETVSSSAVTTSKQSSRTTRSMRSTRNNVSSTSAKTNTTTSTRSMSRRGTRSTITKQEKNSKNRKQIAAASTAQSKEIIETDNSNNSTQQPRKRRRGRPRKS